MKFINSSLFVGILLFFFVVSIEMYDDAYDENNYASNEEVNNYNSDEMDASNFDDDVSYGKPFQNKFSARFIYSDYSNVCINGDEDSYCKCEDQTLNCEKQGLIDTNFYVNDTKFVIKKANFRNNAIKFLRNRSILSGAFEVEELDFSNNFISEIEDEAFNGFDNLKKLHLSSNQLTTIGGELYSEYLTKKVGSSLHQLFLDDNRIKKIPASAFSELWNLKTLVLDGNYGLTFRKTFPTALMNLESLSLDRCGISDLDENVFEMLISLKQLSLRENPINFIPKAINAIPNLIGLDLSGTDIAELLTDEISSDHNLAEIYLSNLEYLYAIYDCAFCGLKNLSKIVLSNNSQLYNIHENAFGAITKQDDPNFVVATLKEFDIHDCNFTYLPEKLIDWTKIETLKIHGNPFYCDCNLAWLVNNRNIHFETNPKCAKPDFLKGKYFSNVTDSVCEKKVPTSTDFSSSSPASPPNKFFGTKWVIALAFTIVALLGLVLSGFLLFWICRNRGTSVLRRSDVSQSKYNILPTATTTK